MFRGRHTYAIDEKGRVSIPSKFRDVLNGRGQQTLMVTNDLDSCLVAFPMDAWAEEEKKIQALPNFVPEALQYNVFISQEHRNVHSIVKVEYCFHRVCGTTLNSAVRPCSSGSWRSSRFGPRSFGSRNRRTSTKSQGTAAVPVNCTGTVRHPTINLGQCVIRPLLRHVDLRPFCLTPMSDRSWLRAPKDAPARLVRRSWPGWMSAPVGCM